MRVIIKNIIINRKRGKLKDQIRLKPIKLYLLISKEKQGNKWNNINKTSTKLKSKENKLKEKNS